MKRISFFILVISLLLTGCSKQPVTVTGKVTGGVLVYTIPISGTSFLGFTDTLKVDETGNFELKLEITQPAFVSMWIPEPFKETKFLIEPGEKYNVVIDNEIQITGANEKGQMLYISLPDPSFIELAITKSLSNDTSLVSIHEKIEKLKQDDLDKFKELLDKKEISPSFFHLIQIDRDCYYASLEARISLIKINRLIRNDNYSLENNKDLLENLGKIYSSYPPCDAKFLFSTFWVEYAEYYVKNYSQYIKKDFDINGYEKMGDTRNTFVINESKKYLTGKALEFFQAKYLYMTAFQTQYEKELIILFEQFKKDYPDSKYSKYIEPLIDEIVKYHQIIDRGFSTDVKFIENYSEINTLKEAIESLKGKKIYIDVWATWCSPCKREFKNNNEALKKILAENDIQMLYISIDYDKQNQQWLDMIKFYNLTGNHIRVNKAFEADLYRIFDHNGNIRIPWYILVDENGNIIDKHAKTPSQLVAGEKLINNE
jgi:thiol-disulfide isomerase/thioredoxin